MLGLIGIRILTGKQLVQEIDLKRRRKIRIPRQRISIRETLRILECLAKRIKIA
jgi:hypothetical protein